MIELHLPLGDVDLRISLIEHEVEEAGKPYLEWFNCELRISVRSFSASVRWGVMPQELNGLADDLTRLYDGFPQRGHVVFKPTYPNLTLDLQIATTGSVIGRCMVVEDVELGDGSEVKANFVLEQRCLPRLALDIRTFVQAASAAT